MDGLGEGNKWASAQLPRVAISKSYDAITGILTLSGYGITVHGGLPNRGMSATGNAQCFAYLVP